MHIRRLALIGLLVVQGTGRVSEAPTSKLADALDVLDDLREGRPPSGLPPPACAHDLREQGSPLLVYDGYLWPHVLL